MRSPAVDAWEHILPVLKSLPGLRVIDIGSGTGRVLQLMADEGYKPTGSDPAKNAPDLEIFCRFPWITMDAMDVLELTGKAFDIATCFDCLEHVPEEILDPTLKAISMLAPNAILGISTKETLSDLHCTVHGSNWWMDRAQQFWDHITLIPHNMELMGQNQDNWILLKCEGR